jgi:tetratricopeptide (TPR) repeat protein
MGMTDMDRRKMFWLSSFVLGSLAGCAHTSTGDKPGNTSQAGTVASAQTASREQPPEPKDVDAKPASLVQIADIQAEVVKDKSRSQADRQNALDLAKTNYRRAIKLDPNCLPAYLGLAHLCSDAGEHDLAIQALDSALAKLPRDASLWYERGMVMGRQKRYDDAIRNLNQAIQLDPSNANYGKSLGLMLAHAGRADEAVVALQHWMSDADAHYNVARILEHIGLAAESQRQLQLALRADPTHQASLAMYKAEAAN